MKTAGERIIRLGTRGSALALFQARAAAEAFGVVGVNTEVIVIATSGDVDRRELPDIGGTGVFTAALEQALLEDRIDAAVHSAKDLPTRLAGGLELAAALERENPRDALVSRQGLRLEDLPKGAKVGTSSARRAAAVLSVRPDLQCAPIRGNVPTRVDKVKRGDYDAAVLAVAGLRRLGLDAEITQVFEPDVMMPAPGQAAIVIEVRSDDPDVVSAARRVSHAPTLIAITAERSVLHALGAGCRTPVGALAVPEDGLFRLHARVWTSDGRRYWSADRVFSPETAVQAGEAVARVLVELGARDALDDRPERA